MTGDRAFLDAGHYQPLRDAIVGQLRERLDEKAAASFSCNSRANSTISMAFFADSPIVVSKPTETYSFQDMEYVKQWLEQNGIPHTSLSAEKMNLEDVFIGLTGKY